MHAGRKFSIGVTNRVDIGEFIRETSSFFHIRFRLVIEFSPSFLHTYNKDWIVRTFMENIAQLFRSSPITFINRLSKYPNNEWYRIRRTKRFHAEPEPRIGVGRGRSDEQFYRFFFVSKSNLKIHRIQLRLIKFQIRDVFDGLRFSSIFPSVNIEKKKKKINK